VKRQAPHALAVGCSGRVEARAGDMTTERALPLFGVPSLPVDACTSDTDRPLIERDVRPLEPERLALAAAGAQQEVRAAGRTRASA
jgi:hypothetical protein